MRIPGVVARYKAAFAATLPGLVTQNDASNRTKAAFSASALYTIWHDPVTGKNRRSSAADSFL